MNKTLLFGNIREIDSLSRHLLNKLEVEFLKTQQNNDAHCCIGEVFNSLIEQFKTTYAEYCRNHEWVHGYLREVKRKQKICFQFESIHAIFFSMLVMINFNSICKMVYVNFAYKNRPFSMFLRFSYGPFNALFVIH